MDIPDDADDRANANRPTRKSAAPASGQKSSSGALWVVAFVLAGVLLIGGGVAGAVAFVLLRKPAPAAPQAAAQENQAANQENPAPPAETTPPTQRVKPNAPSKDGQLAKEMLDYLKDLTVFIKLEAGHSKGSASGFLIKVDGDTGYIVTNEHVVNPELPEPERPERPFGPRFGPPNMPGGFGPPNFPGFGPPGMQRPAAPRKPNFPDNPNQPDFPNMPGMLPPIFEQPESARKIRAKLTVIFGSGTANERSLPAEVLDANAALDLALIRVKGPNLPKPIDLSDRAELNETMTAYVLGFPLGDILSVEGNPAITVNKTTIGSVRKNKNGMPVLVQLQAGRNPGNSGGPVVDADGRLVGIWVGSFEGTQIGLALAPPLLDTLLKRTKAHIDSNTLKATADEVEVEFKVEVFDLLNEVTGVRLLYAPGGLVAKNPAVLDTGEYAAMPNAQALDLKGVGKQFSGRLNLAAHDLKNNQVPVQVGYVHRDGSVHYGKPWSYRIGSGRLSAPANPAAKGPNAGPRPAAAPGVASAQPDANISLLGKMEMAAIGGAGRFVILSLPAEKQVVIFDLKDAKIASTLPLPEEKFLFAANQKHLIVYLPGAKLFQRWSLHTFEREAEMPNPLGVEVKALAMGGASVGPLVAYAPKNEAGATDDLLLLDPITLKPDNWGFVPPKTSWPMAYDPAKASLVCSADGRMILARTNTGFAVRGKRPGGHYSAMFTRANTPLPSADGEVLIDHGQALNHSGQPLGPNRSKQGAAVWCVPALQGGLSVSLNEIHDENNQTYLKTMLHQGGEAEPTAVLAQRIESLSGLVNWFTGQTDPFERHVFFAPEYGVLAVVPWENNRVEVYRFDLDQLLKESKRDYLFVLSQAPPEAAKGSTYRYTVNVKSKKGDVKLQLESSPNGMKLEGDNALVWDVPANFAEPEANVVLSIRDASGQTIRQPFCIRVTEKAKE
ncbi:MAG TPA: serine protease [Gemmataceae bacterium]|nr:serine protease [Gemmataceae bacterium]